jgi:hypothetical protein
MRIIIHLLSALALSISAITAMSNMSIADEVSTDSKPQTTQKICSVDAVDSLLPPIQNQPSQSSLSYLAQQGFIQSSDGSWVCYGRDPKQEGRYYSLFKVQEINGKVIATSFLEKGGLVDGQDNRSLDLFMTLVQQHIKTNQGNRESIQRYLETFISLVKEGKVQPSTRSFLFDQPSRAFVIYHPLAGEKLKGTGITLNIGSPQNTGSPRVSLTGS